MIAPDARTRFALSTMWAMQPRFERDVHAFMERAAELGYDAVEINHSMDAQMVGVILGARVLPVASVHAPAPLEQHPSAGWNRDINIASLDEAERALAVRYTQRSVDLAAQAGAPHVVVHLGSVGNAMLDSERRLRGLWPMRDLLAAEYARAVDEAVRERAALAPPYIEAAARSLAELVAYAQPRGVALGIESRLAYQEIPLAHETAALLAPYPHDVAGYWHDVGHCEVHHRLGLEDIGAWFDLVGPRMLGAHLHDVRELTDHRAPGTGDVDFVALAARMPHFRTFTLEIDQHEADETLVSGLDVLRRAGF